MYIITTLRIACLCQLNLKQFLNSLAQHQCCPLLITCSVEYFYPTTAIINLLILFSRSLSPNETQEMSPLFHHYHILYVFLFILDLGLSANDPVNPISSIHLHQTKSCPNYKSTYLFASNLSFAVPTLNYFHSFNFFRPTSFVQ